MVVLIPKRPYGQSDVAGRQPCRAGDTSAFSAPPREPSPLRLPVLPAHAGAQDRERYQVWPWVPASAGTQHQPQRDAKPVPTGGQFGAPHFLTTHWPFLS